MEPSHGFVAWQALVDGHAPNSSNDPTIAPRAILAPPKRCEDARESMKEKLTAWSSKMAEYEHQFKVIDEAQKTFMVRRMMPKDIKLEFLTGQEIRQTYGKVGALHQRNDGRRMTSTSGFGECPYTQCENDTG